VNLFAKPVANSGFLVVERTQPIVRVDCESRVIEWNVPTRESLAQAVGWDEAGHRAFVTGANRFAPVKVQASGRILENKLWPSLSARRISIVPLFDEPEFLFQNV